MTSELHETAADGFSSAAASYETGRPTYPPAAVAMLVRELKLGTRSVVLDLAAGTGKLTALLVGAGARWSRWSPSPRCGRSWNAHFPA